MTRRRFLLMSLSGAVAVPLGAGAQQPGRVYRVAILHLTSPTPPVRAFRSALRELGWVEGQTLAVDFRSAEGQAERLEVLAAELAASQPDVIVTGTSGAAVAAKRATATIPIVMAVSVDPVGLGVVQSLARPGANITGQAILSPELSAKRLELLNEALPRVGRVAIFWNAAAGRPAVERHLAVSQDAARTLGIQLFPVEVAGTEALDTAFRDATRVRAGAIVTVQSALFQSLNGRLARLALNHRVPVLSSESGFAEAGGLMNYGDDLDQAWRRAAVQVDRILKGASPADLPVEQPTKFQLVINLKTARSLGLMIPSALLLRADQIIE
jgi:putative tryptophan/tyrosine transport system substrate-binding protein